MMLLLICLTVFISYAGIMAVRLRRYLAFSKTIAKRVGSYRRKGEVSKEHILVLGDSTMCGAGVKDRTNSIEGLLARKYPDATIEVLAVSGAKVGDLKAQVKHALYHRYDLLVVGVGGNDIVGFSRYSSVRTELATFLQEAKNLTKQVILFHSVNIGNVGFFPFPLNYLFSHRSRKLSEAFDLVSRQFSSVRYVNFYRPIGSDYYTRATRKKFVASDGFHPTDYANQYFFELLWDDRQRAGK